jgi:hypothetical protein
MRIVYSDYVVIGHYNFTKGGRVGCCLGQLQSWICFARESRIGRKFLTYFWVQYKSSCALVPKGWALFYSLEGNNRLALTPLVDVNKCGCKVSNVVCKVFIVNS